MQTVNIEFLKVLSDFNAIRGQMQSLHEETDKLDATLASLREEERELAGDPAKYKAADRRSLEQTVASLGAEIAAEEARPPKFFGKSEYQARLENLRNRLELTQQSLQRLTREAPERVRRLPELIMETQRDLAEKKAKLEAHDVRFTQLQDGMKLLKGDAYANGMRPAILELMMIGKADDRVAYVEATEALEKGLRMIQGLEGAGDAAKKAELVYIYVQNMLFQKWFRPTNQDVATRHVKLSEELEGVHSDDWLLELAITFGRYVEVAATISGGRRQGFQEDVLLMILGDKLKAVETRLIRVMKEADQDTWKVMAKEHLERVDMLRQST